ncbi:hypothetical protein DPEC_G00188210 [Dallia pectoralis]|uniref:Uncharacterized protein n=1 Tax=Dallia pectoralis TaxID=75939 RepID=A0ACC2GC55_DALPE|nr:hypothetical protein DPEC_G00188210 [Dallia pectoralis]
MVSVPPLAWITSLNEQDGKELTEWSRELSRKLAKGKAEAQWPKDGTWDEVVILAVRTWLINKRKEVAKRSWKRTRRLDGMNKYVGYRKRWGDMLGKTVHATVNEGKAVSKQDEVKPVSKQKEALNSVIRPASSTPPPPYQSEPKPPAGRNSISTVIPCGGF